MIIVSQDKKQIINFDNTGIFIEDFTEDGDGFGIGSCTNSAKNQCWDLGYYKTEERAKEVLSDIVSREAMFRMYKYSKDDTQDIIDIKMIKENLIFDVYEMPKE